MNVLLIGGDFDDNGGRKSGYIEKFANGLRPYHLFVKTINGGYYDELLKISMSECQAILWFANIPNDKPKFVNEIKSKFPKALLVISKNNIDGKYQTMDLVARALKAKANLIIEFTKNESGAICGTILDPLCNCYGGYKHSDVFLLSTLLAKRLWQLINFTRVESKSVGNKIDSCANPSFVETIKWYGDRFHSLMSVDFLLIEITD
jgi:hypothetical protein